MAPVTITHDYYAVLEVEQTATQGEITKSYKRLALQHHPDRNLKQDTTAAFQLLGAAYETLKDESKRRSYDLLYPQIKSSSTKPRKTAPQTPRPTPETKQDDTKEAAAAIAAILKTKQERSAKWYSTRKIYNDAIFELKRDIRKLQSAIKEVDDIEKAEKAEEAAANGWSTWLLSPLYRKRVDTEEEKEEKARDHLQRLHSKSFKQRDLEKKESELRDQEVLLMTKNQEFDEANRKDDAAKRKIEERVRAAEERVRREQERMKREEADRKHREWLDKQQREAARVAKERKEQAEKEAAEWRKKLQAEEAARKKRLEELEAEWRKSEEAREAARKKVAEETRKARQENTKRRPEAARASTNHNVERDRYGFPYSERSFSGAGNSGSFSESDTPFTQYRKFRSNDNTCRHDAWWPKVDGRRACERCSTTYNYLLECPNCGMKACASCQQLLRPPRRGRHTKSSSGNEWDSYFD